MLVVLAVILACQLNADLEWPGGGPSTIERRITDVITALKSELLISVEKPRGKWYGWV